MAAKRIKETQKEKALLSAPEPPALYERFYFSHLTVDLTASVYHSLRTPSSRAASNVASTSKELVPPPITPSLAGVEVQLESIRSHVINSLAAKQLGSNRIAGTYSGPFGEHRVFTDCLHSLA
jgi:hypothetical protein